MQLQQAHLWTETDAMVVYGILMLSGNELAPNGVFFQTGALKDGLPLFLTHFQDHIRGISSNFSSVENTNFPYPLYFMISASQEPVSFCLSVPAVLPTQQYYLKSLGHYRGQSL
ncbi:MAG: hypothetical protein WCJ39_04175 [bacterium]